MRKSGLGTAEKKMVLKDVKTLKGTTEEVEMAESESKDEGRNMLTMDV